MGFKRYDARSGVCPVRGGTLQEFSLWRAYFGCGRTCGVDVVEERVDSGVGCAEVELRFGEAAAVEVPSGFEDAGEERFLERAVGAEAGAESSFELFEAGSWPGRTMSPRQRVRGGGYEGDWLPCSVRGRLRVERFRGWRGLGRRLP